jgi:hypothetical protein
LCHPLLRRLQPEGRGGCGRVGVREEYSGQTSYDVFGLLLVTATRPRS